MSYESTVNAVVELQNRITELGKANNELVEINELLNNDNLLLRESLSALALEFAALKEDQNKQLVENK